MFTFWETVGIVVLCILVFVTFMILLITAIESIEDGTHQVYGWSMIATIVIGFIFGVSYIIYVNQ